MLDQRVGLVNEENLALGTSKHFPNALRGLSHIACHQRSTPHFNDLGALQNTDLIQNPGENARHRSLCRAGIPAELHIERHAEISLSLRLHFFLHFGKRRNFFNLHFYLV